MNEECERQWKAHVAASAHPPDQHAQAVFSDVERIARRYKNCAVNIYPECPEMSPVEAVLRCAKEEGFILTTERGAAAARELREAEVRLALIDEIGLLLASYEIERGQTYPGMFKKLSDLRVRWEDAAAVERLKTKEST